MNADDLARLRKLCGMLSSDAEGERATAARMATDLLKRHGKTWADIGLGGSESGVESVLARKLSVAAAEAIMLRGLLTDAQNGLRLARSQVDDLKRQLKAAHEKSAPRSAADRKTYDAPPPKSDDVPRTRRVGDEQKRRVMPDADNDDAMRAEAKEYVADAESGVLDIPETTVDFLSNVADREHWTSNQRSAMERTLNWVRRKAGRRVA